MTTLSKPFALTPQTGERLSRVSALAADANLSHPLFGHGVMETSLGRNLGFALVSARLAAALRAVQGPVALDRALVLAGSTVSVPDGATAFLGGYPLGLSAQSLNFSGFAAGAYLVVIEAWQAAVGPTTLGRATQPEIYVGVTDTVNKPDATHLFPAGNVDAGVGPSEADLVGATVQTQKFVQWQYRLRVTSAASVGAYSAQTDLIPLRPEVPGVPDGPQVKAGVYAPFDGPLWRAVIDPEAGAYPRALDRTLYAAALARVTVDATGLSVQHGRPGYVTDLAALLPDRGGLARVEEERALALAERLALIERRGAYAEYATDESLAVQDLAAGGLSLDQRLALLPPLMAGDAGVSYDAARVSRITATRAARLRVTVSATFLAGSTSSGAGTLSLLRNGAATGFASSCAFAGTNVALNLVAEVSVGAGEVLEIGVSQTSGALMALAPGARVVVTSV